MRRTVLFKSGTEQVRIEQIEGLDLSRIQEKADEDRHQAERYLLLSGSQIEKLRKILQVAVRAGLCPAAGIWSKE